MLEFTLAELENSQVTPKGKDKNIEQGDIILYLTQDFMIQSTLSPATGAHRNAAACDLLRRV